MTRKNNKQINNLKTQVMRKMNGKLQKRKTNLGNSDLIYGIMDVAIGFNCEKVHSIIIIDIKSCSMKMRMHA